MVKLIPWMTWITTRAVSVLLSPRSRTTSVQGTSFICSGRKTPSVMMPKIQLSPRKRHSEIEYPFSAPSSVEMMVAGTTIRIEFHI